MWSNKNILDVTKAGVAQLINKGYMDVEDGNLTQIDAQYIVDLGKKIEAASDGNITENNPADIFFKALISQMGKIVVDTRSYVAELPKLYVDAVNWGLFREHIFIDLSDVLIDEMWNSDGFINYSDPSSSSPKKLSGAEEGSRIASLEFGCFKPPVSAKLYNKVHGIMIALTTAKEQFFTAFRSLEEYSTFLAGLFNSVENTLQVKAEVYAHMCVSMGIATAKANNNEINLLTEYNTLTNKTLTVANCMNDAEFLRYALQRISEVRYNITRYSASYNNHEHVTFASDPQLILLNQFATATKFGLRANTYNEQLIGVGQYDTVSSWQSVVSSSDPNPYNLSTASTISLTPAAAKEAGLVEADGNEGVITGVLGVVYDRMAMGVTVDRKKTTSQYSATRDTTNYFYHALVSYIVDSNYPIVSFVIRET